MLVTQAEAPTPWSHPVATDACVPLTSRLLPTPPLPHLPLSPCRLPPSPRVASPPALASHATTRSESTYLLTYLLTYSPLKPPRGASRVLSMLRHGLI